MTRPAIDPEVADSELGESEGRHILLGERPGNHKEVHNHYSNGSQKIVWAWASVSTAIAIGAVWAYINSNSSDKEDQSTTNRQVAAAMTDLSIKVAEQGAELRAVQTTLARLERTVDQRP